MAKNIEVVVIHGSHKHHEGLNSDGKPVKVSVKKLGDSLTLPLSELKAVDPLFSLKSGKGDRFATPAVAKKLAHVKQLQDELDAAEAEGDEPDDVDDDVDDEAAAEDGHEEPAPTPPAAPEVKKSKAKKGKG